jgi:hypothetical protein
MNDQTGLRVKEVCAVVGADAWCLGVERVEQSAA